MAINQIKVANEAKQDTQIANNAEILEELDDYGTIKSIQNGEIVGLSNVVVGEHAAGSELNIVSINPVNVDKSKLIAKYTTLHFTNPSASYSYPSLSLKSDGIYTTPSVRLFDQYSIKNLTWSVVEYY